MMYHLLEILHGSLLQQQINHCTEPLQSMGPKSVITLKIPDCILPIGSSLKETFSIKKSSHSPLPISRYHPIPSQLAATDSNNTNPSSKAHYMIRPSREPPKTPPEQPVTRDSVVHFRVIPQKFSTGCESRSESKPPNSKCRCSLRTTVPYEPSFITASSAGCFDTHPNLHGIDEAAQ